MADELSTAIPRPDLTHANADFMEVNKRGVRIPVEFGDGNKVFQTYTVHLEMDSLTSAEKSALHSIQQKGIVRAVLEMEEEA